MMIYHLDVQSSRLFHTIENYNNILLTSRIYDEGLWLRIIVRSICEGKKMKRIARNGDHDLAQIIDSKIESWQELPSTKKMEKIGICNITIIHDRKETRYIVDNLWSVAFIFCFSFCSVDH